MADLKSREATRTDRVVAVVLAPFVLGWDFVRSGFFRLCGFMEKLDPFAALEALFGRFAAPVVRAIRAGWQKTLLLRIRIKAGLVVVYGWFLTAIRPVVRALRPAIDRIGRILTAVVRSVSGFVRRSASAVRRVAGPAFGRARRLMLRIWATSAAPVRRAAASTRAAFYRGLRRS